MQTKHHTFVLFNTNLDVISVVFWFLSHPCPRQGNTILSLTFRFTLPAQAIVHFLSSFLPSLNSWAPPHGALIKYFMPSCIYKPTILRCGFRIVVYHVRSSCSHSSILQKKKQKTPGVDHANTKNSLVVRASGRRDIGKRYSCSCWYNA